jgi:hypothetical protein
MVDTKIRIANLTTIQGVARELASVYRMGRRGTIDTGDCARLAGVLTAIKSCLETSALELRIDGIERAVGLAKPVVKLVPKDAKP